MDFDMGFGMNTDIFRSGINFIKLLNLSEPISLHGTRNDNI